MFGLFFRNRTEIEGRVTKGRQDWEHEVMSIENPPTYEDQKQISEMGELRSFELVAAIPETPAKPSEYDRNPRPRILLFFKKPRS